MSIRATDSLKKNSFWDWPANKKGKLKRVEEPLNGKGVVIILSNLVGVSPKISASLRDYAQIKSRRLRESA